MPKAQLSRGYDGIPGQNEQTAVHRERGEFRSTRPRHVHESVSGSERDEQVDVAGVGKSLTALVVGTVFLFGGTSGVVLSLLYREEEEVECGDAFVVEEGKSDSNLLASGSQPLLRPLPKKRCLWRHATKLRRWLEWVHQRAFQVLVAGPNTVGN